MGGLCCNVRFAEEWVGGWDGMGWVGSLTWKSWGTPCVLPHTDISIFFFFLLQESCCHACVLRPTLIWTPSAQKMNSFQRKWALGKVGMSPLWQHPTTPHPLPLRHTHIHTLCVLQHSSSGSLSDHYLHNYMLSSEEKTNPQILRVT